jgi:hypothetical protein
MAAPSCCRAHGTPIPKTTLTEDVRRRWTWLALLCGGAKGLCTSASRCTEMAAVIEHKQANPPAYTTLQKWGVPYGRPTRTTEPPNALALFRTPCTTRRLQQSALKRGPCGRDPNILQWYPSLVAAHGLRSRSSPQYRALHGAGLVLHRVPKSTPDCAMVQPRTH